MSPDGDMEYFGDGMAEEILNVLAKVPDLKVAGRTSSFSFKNRATDLNSIGTALGVGTLLEGSIRRSASQLRVTAQLVRTDDQSHLWSETFDRGFDEDVFQVQDEIARAIAQALEVELGGAEAPTVADQRGTQNIDAYNAYLLGRFRWNRRTREGVLGSIRSFDEAIRLDPGYARAFAGLADGYSIAANFGWMPPREAFPRAREAVDRALALDPVLPDAYTSIEAVLSWYEWDFEAAEEAFLTAIELDSGSAFAHYWYAIMLDRTNRPGEARTALDIALELDPLALQIRNGLGNHLYWAEDYDGAIREYRAILVIDPDFQNARTWLARAYEDSGSPAAALAVLDSIPASFFGVSETPRALALAKLGRDEEALERLEARGLEASVASAAVARAYFLLGRPDEAFRVLRAAIEERQYLILDVGLVPKDDPIRSDPRFDTILADIGLLCYWQ